MICKKPSHNLESFDGCGVFRKIKILAGKFSVKDWKKFVNLVFSFPNGLLVEHQGWKLVSSKSKCKK